MSDMDRPDALRSDARRVLAIWREAEGMPPAVMRRVWQRLQEPARVRMLPRRPGEWAWAVAIAAVVLLGWWGVVELRTSASARDRGAPDQAVADRRAAPSERAAIDPLHPPAEPPPALAPIAPQQPPPPLRPPPAPRRSTPTPTTELPASAVLREREPIARAWSALAAGDPSGALRETAAHARSFPAGILAPERGAIEIIARCQRGDREAPARARTWIGAQPRSPLIDKVRSACGVMP